MPVIISDKTDKLGELSKNYSVIGFTDKIKEGYLYKPLAITSRMCEYLQAANNSEMCEEVIKDFLSTPRAKRAFSVLKLMSEYCNILCICPSTDCVNLLRLYVEAFRANGLEVKPLDE